jgi:hypothetical protein
MTPKAMMNHPKHSNRAQIERMRILTDHSIAEMAAATSASLKSTDRKISLRNFETCAD